MELIKQIGQSSKILIIEMFKGEALKIYYEHY